jgi:hypothetical protein
MKDNVLTRGGLCDHEFDVAEKSAEVIVPQGYELRKLSERTHDTGRTER